MYLHAAHAAHAPNAAITEEMKAYQSEQASANTGGSKTIKGNVVRVEYDDFVVKEKNGKEVRVRTDRTTQVIGQLKQGDRIEAEIDAQDRALWIRSFPE